MLPIWIVGGHAYKLSERNPLTSGTKRLFRIKGLLKTTVVAAGSGLIGMRKTEHPLQVVKAALPEQDNSKSIAAGAEVYAANCAHCHGINREGAPPSIPSLVGVTKKLSDEEIAKKIHDRKAPMPHFSTMPKDQVNAHVDLFSRYTDDDIHNLMAYIQTLH